MLSSLGHKVEEAAPEWVDATLAPAFIQLISTGTGVVAFLPREELEPLNRFLIDSAEQITSVQHIQALTQIHAYARKVVQWWEGYDVLLTPTLALPPVEIGWVFSDDDPMGQLIRSGMFIPFTPMANVTGLPAVSVPFHKTDAGLPVGVQLVGSPANEAELIRLCAQIEDARPWTGDRPPGC